MKHGKAMAMFVCGFLLGSALAGLRGTASAGVTVTAVPEEAPATPPAPKTPLPFVIYAGDAISKPYSPTGWMGNSSAVGFNDHCTEYPHSGATCIRVDYRTTGAWAGIVWQDPPNDWGDKNGGHDLTGASKLTFWARGAAGGEKVEFYFGVIKAEKPFSDSDTGRITVTLTRTWSQYGIDLTGKNLSHIKTGFGWSLAGQGRPVTFYLDDIQYE
jgi:hypothetical protein